MKTLAALLVALALVALPYTAAVTVSAAPVAAAIRPLPWTHFSVQANDAIGAQQGACPRGEVFFAALRTPAGEQFMLFVETGDEELRWLIVALDKERQPTYVWSGRQEQDTAQVPDGHDRIVPRDGHPFDSSRDNDVCRALYPEHA